MNTEISLSRNLDELLTKVSEVIEPSLELHSGQFRSDTTILSVVVSAIVSIVTAIAANQLPQGYFDKRRPLSRTEAHELVEQLRSDHFSVDLNKNRNAIISSVEEALPTEVKDRRNVANRIVEVFLTHLKL